MGENNNAVDLCAVLFRRLTVVLRASELGHISSKV